MSSLSLFHYDQLLRVANHAAMVWKQFLSIEKLSKTSNNKAAKPILETPPEPEAAARRYLKILLKLDDPTATESVINAAFSSLGERSLRALKTQLDHHQRTTQSNLERSQTPKEKKNASTIQFIEDAYFKTPSMDT